MLTKSSQNGRLQKWYGCLARIIKSGPYYVHKGDVYAVSRVYPDRQLAFVQAVGPSEGEYGYVGSLNPYYIQSDMSNIGLLVRLLILWRLEMRIEDMELLYPRDRIIPSHLLQLRKVIDSSKSKRFGVHTKTST